MNKFLLFVCGAVAFVNAQTAPPKWLAPTRAHFVELTAYNYAGYTTQQLWSSRHIERIVKFDTNMNCVYEGQKSYGTDKQFDAYCWSRSVAWRPNTNPQCTTSSFSYSVSDKVKQFWAQYDQFTKYDGQFDDPFYTTGLKYHRMKHAT